QQAASNFEAGKTQAALAWASTVSQQSDNSNDLWISGKILAKIGQLEDAIKRFQRLRELEPGNSEIALALACCYANGGDADAALQAIDVASLDLDSQLTFAMSLERGGHTAQALELLTAAH